MYVAGKGKQTAILKLVLSAGRKSENGKDVGVMHSSTSSIRKRMVYVVSVMNRFIRGIRYVNTITTCALRNLRTLHVLRLERN